MDEVRAGGMRGESAEGGVSVAAIGTDALARALAVAAVEESPEVRCARYERALKAIAECTLTGTDFGDWVQEACVDVLSGLDACCWDCGTVVHNGPCAGGGE